MRNDAERPIDRAPAVTSKRVTDGLRFLAALAILVIAAVRWFDAHGEHQGPVEPGIQAGTRIPNSHLLGIPAAGRGLLLVTASTCHFCRESMPFYQKLVSLAKHTGTKIIGVASEDPEVNAAYLSSNAIPVDAVLAISDVGFSVRGTPTLVLVDADGIVKKSWAGKLSTKAEAEILGLFPGS